MSARIVCYIVFTKFIFCALLACTPNVVTITGIPATASAARQMISLSGVWKFKPGNLQPADLYSSRINDQSWADIKVPANWYLEGYDISGIGWYRTHFTLPRELADKQFTLQFNGVDYTADVWLNDQYIGFHEGYFQPFSFNVTQAVDFDQDNVLSVKVNSPLETSGADWSLHKRLIKGIFGHHDTRPGGAWSERAQEKNTGGIWGAVKLLVHDAALIEQLNVTPQLQLDQHRATAAIAYQVNLLQREALTVKVKTTLTPFNFSAEKISQETEQKLQPGVNQISSALVIDQPRLWWPWEQGKANLYTLEIALTVAGRVVDSKQVTFGFRDIDYDPNKQVWRINGKRMFLRGTNYIATQWLSEMDAQRFGFDIALMKQANINTVRVHAHVTAEDFYRLCDEAGLLVWQDFPLQWGYSDDQSVHDSAAAQLKDMIEMLYNHPSVIVWSLHNEPPWDADWMKYKYRQYDPEQNRQLTEHLYTVAKPLDTSRYLHRYSSTAEHPWLGWYSGSWLDYMKPTQLTIVAEFGAQALPDISSLRKIFSEEDLWPENDQQWAKWEYHNFQRHETFNNAKVAMGETIAEFVDNTQQYQAKLIKLAAESYRRQRYKPVNSIFQFMFVEDWPSMNWGVVDYWRQPKPGYYALKQAYQPVLPSIAWDKEHFTEGETVTFDLWVINDLLQRFPSAQIAYSLRKNEKLVDAKELSVDIADDSGVYLTKLTWENLAAGHYELVVKIEDSHNKPLGINTHKFDVKRR